MVATPHRLATQAGIAALRAGGNALDAAVAAATTIAVVYPHMNGLGGDNLWLIYDARHRALRALNAAGRSAAAATLERYRARHGAVIPARGGPAALTVPGTVSGWWEAHDYSRRALGSPLSWARLLDEAIAHAVDGFPCSAGQRRVTAAAADLFGPAAPAEVRSGLWPIYHPERLDAPRFTQPELGRTLHLIRDGGADEFYRGALGRRLAEAAEAAGSPLTVADLAEHRADWVEALTVPYRGGQAASFPPPSQGFAALAILALLEGFDLRAANDADHVHLVVEATKLAFEDRDRILADPTVVAVDVGPCLDPDRLGRRRARIALGAARPTDGAPMAGDTIAIVTADAEGNAVSLIQSLYHEFGSGVVAGDTGVVLQNRGSFFSLDPAAANALAPGKRTLHTLIPSMYLRGGRACFVHGTMGGEGQPQTQAAMLTRWRHRGLGPQAAVEASRWLYGRTWGTPTRALSVEGRFPAELARQLAERGHDVRVAGEWDDLFGHAQCIWLSEDGLVGGSDPRADGGALGF
jgi:gamma-glutamyltranspeptidase/glutathione hydrolase